MQQEIKTFRLSLPYKLGSVNAYLIQTDTGYFLIDTGSSNQLGILEKELESAGCRSGDLKLIVLTHGDFDHTGNAAYLRQKFNAPIAMHLDDLGMVEHGDMFWNRKRPNMLIRMMVPLFFRFGQSKRFKPDLFIDEESDLSEYGLDVQVLYIPGHSKGSIGVLTSDGDLIGGDLFQNTRKPDFNSLMDDLSAAKASLQKLKQQKIKTVYPGHGKPFSMDQLPESTK